MIQTIALVVLGVLLIGSLAILLPNLKVAQRIVKEREAQLQERDTQLRESQDEISRQQERISRLQDELTRSKSESAGVQAQAEQLREEIKALKEWKQEEQELMQSRFKVVADELLRNRASDLSQSNKKELDSLLLPLKEQMVQYQTELRQINKDQEVSRAAMGEQIKQLSLQAQKIGNDAVSLAQALKKDPQRQGAWGEEVLQRLLQLNGFVPGTDYTFQESLTDSSGQRIRNQESGHFLRTDIIINLPDNKALIIDSKVSLAAYADYTDANQSAQQSANLDRHLRSLHDHIATLSRKAYQDHLKDRHALDFVLLFVPLPGALNLALEKEPALWEEAYAKRIILVSPIEIVSVIKMIAGLWKLYAQEENVQKIIERANGIYDKMAGVCSAVDDAYKAMEKMQVSLDAVRGRLYSGSGNVIGQFEKLKKLGLNPKKQIPLPQDFASEQEELPEPETAVSDAPVS